MTTLEIDRLWVPAFAGTTEYPFALHTNRTSLSYRFAVTTGSLDDAVAPAEAGSHIAFDGA